MTPEICKSHTFHKRIGGPDNAFRYSVDLVLLEPEGYAPMPRLMSRNKANLTAINDRNHGGTPKHGRGAEWVREKLAERGLKKFEKMRVLLLAQPSFLGFVFNPVSFWFIADEEENLYAVIAEVNNTFGDRHSYICYHDDLRQILPEDTLTAHKLMHVSPFQKTEGTYSFRFDLSAKHYGIRIDYRVGNGGLLATLTGKREKLTSMSILSSLMRRPVASLRVITLIHFQALVLKLKGAKYLPRPAPPQSEISR